MLEDENIQVLVTRHKQNGLLIDTNLLLLLAVGRLDRRRIQTFKRTSQYTLSDFQRLAWLASQFNLLLTTPNILTEVDNLGRQLSVAEWRSFAAVLNEFVLVVREEFITAKTVCGNKLFPRLGLTDTLTLAVGQPFLLLSDDFDLYQSALSAGHDAINFNHLRL